MIVPTNTVRFIKDDKDEQLMMTMRTGVTWSELSEKYIHFLKGCGYQVTAADLAEYYTTLSGD